MIEFKHCKCNGFSCCPMFYFESREEANLSRILNQKAISRKLVIQTKITVLGFRILH